MQNTAMINSSFEKDESSKSKVAILPYVTSAEATLTMSVSPTCQASPSPAEPVQRIQKLEQRSSSNDSKLFSCLKCSYETDRKNNLKRHVSTMHDPAPTSLDCCAVKYTTKGELREHTRTAHGSGYTCWQCGHTFCRRALLHRHQSVHSGHKAFSCSKCGYQSSHKSNMQRHMQVHLQPKNSGLSTTRVKLKEKAKQVFNQRANNLKEGHVSTNRLGSKIVMHQKKPSEFAAARDDNNIVNRHLVHFKTFMDLDLRNHLQYRGNSLNVLEKVAANPRQSTNAVNIDSSSLNWPHVQSQDAIILANNRRNDFQGESSSFESVTIKDSLVENEIKARNSTGLINRDVWALAFARTDRVVSSTCKNDQLNTFGVPNCLPGSLFSPRKVSISMNLNTSSRPMFESECSTSTAQFEQMNPNLSINNTRMMMDVLKYRYGNSENLIDHNVYKDVSNLFVDKRQNSQQLIRPIPVYPKLLPSLLTSNLPSHFLSNTFDQSEANLVPEISVIRPNNLDKNSESAPASQKTEICVPTPRKESHLKRTQASVLPFWRDKTFVNSHPTTLVGNGMETVTCDFTSSFNSFNKTDIENKCAEITNNRTRSSDSEGLSAELQTEVSSRVLSTYENVLQDAKILSLKVSNEPIDYSLPKTQDIPKSNCHGTPSNEHLQEVGRETISYIPKKIRALNRNQND